MSNNNPLVAKDFTGRRFNQAFGIFLAFSFVIGIPLRASADVGTPLLWAGMLHLFIGNAFIGVFEGLLIAWLFSVRKGMAIGIMIPANYFSAWMGFFFVRCIGNNLPADLNTYWRWFWVMAFATYGLTLVLEWPFVAWCFRGNPHWFCNSIRASLVAQSASYLLLFGWYGVAGNTELYSDLRVVKPSELSLPANMSVYYISMSDGNVYRRPLQSGKEIKVCDLPSTNQWKDLTVRRNASNTNNWDLLLLPHFTVLAKAIPIQNAAVEPDQDELQVYGHEAGRFGDVTNRNWIVLPHYWDNSLVCDNRSLRQRMYLTCDTVFCRWTAGKPAYLNADLVLFELNGNQICVFSPDQRKIALLWRGKGAVPIINRD